MIRGSGGLKIWQRNACPGRSMRARTFVVGVSKIRCDRIRKRVPNCTVPSFLGFFAASTGGLLANEHGWQRFS